MLEVVISNSFKKDYKNIMKRGYNPKLFEEVLTLLMNEVELPSKYKEHNLIGNYKGYKECHILPDWLFIYKIDKSVLTLTLTRTGTHSDLF